MNTAAAEAFAHGETPFSVIHVTGRADVDRVASLGPGPGATAAPGARPNPRYQAHAYLNDFELALAVADVAVARAGGSVAELLARGIPSVLVPFPAATGDHQTKNARELEADGAAVLLPDAELTAERLAAEVARVLEPGTRASMSARALALARPDAATRIADEIVQLAGPPRAPTL